MSELLTKVKENLILEHSVDDGLIERFITAAGFLCGKLSAHRGRILYGKMRCLQPRNKP